jgi:tetratricopeptide (TPR) repeat protein
MPSTKSVCLMLGLALLLNGCSSLPSRSTDSGDKPSSVGSALQRSYTQALDSLRQGELERAMREFQQLAQANPRLSGPMTNIGIIHLKQNAPDAAEKAFQEALSRNPDSVPAHNQLGVALRLQGRFQEAEAAYQSALDLDPTYLLAHRNLGILYDLYLSQPAKALEQYRLCQQLTENGNQEFEGWILDLERRVAKGN